MDKLKIKFENCFGLKSFEHEFNFSNGCTQVIYAPNGAMKSSFAKVFECLSDGTLPVDRVFKDRVATFDIKCNDDDSELAIEKIFVIPPYQNEVKYERVSTLLVNQDLKNEYDGILEAINSKKEHLLKNLEKHSGIKGTIAKEISIAFQTKESEFLDTLVQLSPTINDGIDPEFSYLSYKELFNDKVTGFLDTKDFKSKLDDYLNTYDALISNSTYFKKGVFTHNNADTVSKSLKDNGFFKASHTVSLNSSTGKKELANQEDYDDEIQLEKSKILTDDTLTKKFAAMDSAITKNGELKNFRSYLENYPEVRQELADLTGLRKKLWLSYFKVEIILFNELVDLYAAGKIEIARIVEQAKTEEAEWKVVVNNFNDRFDVPYRLLVENQDEVILNNAVPSVIFEYHDGLEHIKIGGADLLNVLSTGERRALYLLNILFEIENRKKRAERSLIIIDDIADSFDYRNKYAIVEYLKDMIDCEKFRMLILTHNFDFYRTIISRLSINKWNNCFLSLKTDTGVKLVLGKDSIEVFTDLKSHYHRDNYRLIAAIPFVRNIIEYTFNTANLHYQTLTGLLHFKQERGTAENPIKATIDVTVHDIEQIFNETFNVNIPIPNADMKVFDLIINTANLILNAQVESVNIENKLILSLAIRLKAEQFMINKLNNPAFVATLNKFQTPKLIKKYSEDFAGEIDNIKKLRKVNIMTPENIHLNSFMYEPILDMSDHHLKTLYSDILSLA